MSESQLIHTPSTTSVIYQSTNYDNFTMILGNRELDMVKIKNIIDDIKAGNNELPYRPIQIWIEENKMPIHDGQHRFYISQALGEPVYYIIMPEKKTLKQIASVNSNVSKWTNKNFINCYTVYNNEH